MPLESITLLQTIILAVTQGITELFPVSSVAHAVLTPFLLGWHLDPGFLKQHFLPLVVSLHVGTALALLVFFWRDWWQFLASLGGGSADHADGRRTFIRVVIGTVPAAVIGLLLEKQLAALFSNPRSAGIFLFCNGLLLFVGEKLRSRTVDHPDRLRIQDLGYVDALVVGLAQALALIPGFSRSGASMIAGFWTGLSHGEAARYSMLLATPIIAGAGILEVPKLLHHSAGTVLQMALIGGVVAGVVAFISVWALMTWFRRREIDAMLPFAVYCWVVGAAAILL